MKKSERYMKALKQRYADRQWHGKPDPQAIQNNNKKLGELYQLLTEYRDFLNQDRETLGANFAEVLQFHVNDTAYDLAGFCGELTDEKTTRKGSK